jgi:hypothetical protein
MMVRERSKVRLCNYPLTLMVIAYPQQIPCPIIHFVQQLLTVTDVDIHQSSFCSFLMAKQDKLPLLLKNTYKPVCVQDPFELNFNVCRNLSEYDKTIFKCRSFEAVVKMYQLKRNPSLLPTLF